MDEERDLVVFEDDAGNQITMEVLDYLFYEGKQYALLAELSEACDNCQTESCEGCETPRDAYVMEVVDAGNDMEEFVPVDEDLAERLLDIMENSDFDEEEFDGEAFEGELPSPD